MGEYARYRGARVKIGTCEDMLYLRADQRHRVEGSDVDFGDPDVLAVVRFRFPWPDEDSLAPGSFDDPFRAMRLWGVTVPEGVEHGNVQFRASNGYLLTVPCPEGPDAPAGIMRNGYGGAASLIQQAYRGGRWVGIARCNGCRAVYRLEDGAEIEAAAAIRSEADRKTRDADRNGTDGDREIARQLHETADRLLAGYPVLA